MAQSSNQLEARVFRSHRMDGALDVSAGAALVLTGVFWLTGPAVGQSLAPVLAFVLYPILRARITEPRTGYVRFCRERRARLTRMHWVMIGVGVAALALGIGLYVLRGQGGAESTVARTLVPALPAALVGVMALGGAIMLGLGRFVVYAGVLFAAGAGVVIIDTHPGWALLGGGIVGTVVGLVLLVRFVHDHPVMRSVME